MPAVQTLIIPVRDLDTSKRGYAALLGVPPVMDEAYYVGFDVDGQDIGLDPHGHARGMTAPVAYCHVADLDSALAPLLASGWSVVQGAQDVGGGKLIATVSDPDGNVIGLLQPA